MEITDPERHFLHWETFESAYIHLGNIRYLLDRIWGLFRRLDPTLKRREIFDYLLDAEKQEFKSLYLSEKDVNGKDCSILNLRNNFVHSSRIASINIKDFYYVPINLEKNVIWRTQLDCTTYDRTDIKLGEDIKRVELLLNKVEQIFSVLLKQYLDKNGIRVIKNGG